MAQESLERLRDDLETLQAATGLAFPYERAHVRTTCVFAASAFAAAGLALLTQGVGLGWRVSAELAVLFIPTTLYAHLRKVPAPAEGRQLRELGGFTLVYFVVQIAAIVLAAWLVLTRGLGLAHFLLVVSAVTGAHLLTVAVKDRRQRHLFLAGIGTPLMAVVYLLTGLPLDLLITLLLGVSGVGQALVWRSQLRALGRW